MEIHVDGRRETLDLQVTLTFQNQRFEGGDLGKAQARVRAVRPSCLHSLTDQSACTVISGGTMPGRGVLSGILLGTLRISY